MKVSVITVVRNAATTIADTLDSVSGQTAAQIEHIVVDGASTDATLDVVRAKGAHIAHLLSEPDAGIYEAFNKGLALATGDVIAYLNAGDSYVDREVVAGVVQQFSLHQVDAIFGDVLIVGSKDHSRVLRYYGSAKFNPSRLAYGYMPAHPALFLRRNVYDRVGKYDVSYRQTGDFEFCIRAFRKHRVSYFHMPKALVRMPTGGVSNRGLRSKLVNSREMLRACRSNGVTTSYLRLSLRLPLKLLETRFVADR